MVQLLDVLNKYVRPYKQIFLFLVIFAVFVYVIYWRMNQTTIEGALFDNVANSINRTKDAVIYFFHADWCPHCKKAEPEWKAFQSSHNEKVINGYTIKCQDVNCTDESDTNSNTLINKFNIDSYPTIKMEREGKIIDFDSKVTASALGSFANMMLAN